MIESKPEDLVGDRAYDSDPLKRFDVETSRGAYVIVDRRTSDPIARATPNS
jgi:hypothetical protein